MNTYTFHKSATEAQRDGAVLSLRKDGFSASREAETLRTDANGGNVALATGGAVIHAFPAGRWTSKPAPVKIDPGYTVEDTNENCPCCRRKLVVAPEGAGIILWCKNTSCESPVMSEGAEAATVEAAYLILESREEKRPAY